MLFEPGAISSPIVMPVALRKSTVSFATSAPLRVESPPTVNVFDPVIDVAPLSDMAPVPVENVPDPDCVRLPLNVRLPDLSRL